MGKSSQRSSTTSEATTGVNTLVSPATGTSTKSNKDKIGICGVGMVGTQVKDWFTEQKYPVFIYDKFKKLGSVEELNQADIIFVCVNTPYKEGEEYDLSHLEDAISKIEDYKIVVIKSTVSPGTTDYFQNKYPNKTFIFNPEFLTELSARKDFFEPDMQIIGIPYQAYNVATRIMLMLPPSKVMRVVSPIDAEWVKKLRNAYYSMKVVFFNQMYDIIQKNIGADYETIRSIVVEDPRIGNSHSFIYHKNRRGFGGACLPKDTYSLIDFAKRLEADSELLEVVKKINLKLNGGKK